MVCMGIWKQLMSKKCIPFEKFKEIMKHKEDTIDILCKEISKLKKELRRANEIFFHHNTFLKEKNLYDEYQEWKKQRNQKKRNGMITDG